MKIPKFMVPGKSNCAKSDSKETSETKGMDQKLIDLIESEIIDSKSWARKRAPDCSSWSYLGYKVIENTFSSPLIRVL